MKRFASIVLWIFILFANWVIYSYHLGVYPRAHLTEGSHQGVRPLAPPATPALAKWMDKKELGINQLILSGDPYTRGLHAGELARPLLLKEENELVAKLRGWVPNGAVLQGLILIAINWFNGIDRYFEPWALEEMYGVSKSAPHEYDYLADGLTRQVAYHGLHEVGQLMVDQKGDDMGCTVVATPYRSNWILGRNFDFEGGRVFDEDKILKWVFPDVGNAYVSVIWAGMVGAVTGVNEHGLYISMNAAGTTDFKRLGTPSTLILLKALQFSHNLDEAIAIIEREQMFITDIYVLLDASSGRLVRIEKSPLHTEVIPLVSPAAVTNHLVAARWQNDPVNLFRKNELTSAYRETRALKLVDLLDHEKIQDPEILENRILKILRDKGEEGGKELALGNRRAIDPLIAAHSVIYNAAQQILFVSQGPSLAGGFTGFDLRASFKARAPIEIRRLARDSEVSDESYVEIHRSEKEVALAEGAAAKKDCTVAELHLSQVSARLAHHSDFLTALGDLHHCRGEVELARQSWTKALAAFPAYAKDIRSLKEKLK